MRRTEAIKFFGSQTAVGRAIGVSQASVQKWTDEGIPVLRQLQIEIASKGKLKADRTLLRAHGLSPPTMKLRKAA
jgi:DNA-binding transcriptional regulator YdaS (Cro superfamily)